MIGRRSTWQRSKAFVLTLALAGAVVAAGCATPAASATPPASAAAASARGSSTLPAQSVSPSAIAGLPAFAPDEPLILFGQLTGAGGGEFVMRPGGTDIQQLGTDVLPGVHKRGDWSPDGQRVVFIDETTERMWIAHLDGTASEHVAACDAPGCDYPAWSPDGMRIAVSRYESKAGVTGPASVGIYVVELISGKVSPVVKLDRPLLADVPRWSPDGMHLVFQVDRMDDEAFETGAALVIVAVGGGKPRYLTTFDKFATTPDWGWITDEIVYSTDLIGAKRSPGPDDETWNLFAIRPDGSHARRITNVQAGQRLQSPRWTPDGNALTAYDHMASGGIRVNPTTGTFEPFATSGTYTRPLIRPVPSGG